MQIKMPICNCSNTMLPCIYKSMLIWILKAFLSECTQEVVVDSHKSDLAPVSMINSIPQETVLGQAVIQNFPS